MKLLYTVCATAAVERRFKRALEIQTHLSGALSGWDKVLFTDRRGLSFVPDGYQIVEADLWTGKKFNPAKWKNATMRFAFEKSYDWMIQANCDVVLLQPPTSFPWNGFTSVMTYQCMPKEDPETLIRRFKEGEELAWIGSSNLIMGSKIFSQFSFCEDFYGYGYEDADFMTNILWPKPNLIQRLDGTPYGARAIHCHNSDPVWGDGEDVRLDMDRNRNLFEERFRALKQNGRMP